MEKSKGHLRFAQNRMITFRRAILSEPILSTVEFFADGEDIYVAPADDVVMPDRCRYGHFFCSTKTWKNRYNRILVSTESGL